MVDREASDVVGGSEMEKLEIEEVEQPPPEAVVIFLERLQSPTVSDLARK